MSSGYNRTGGTSACHKWRLKGGLESLLRVYFGWVCLSLDSCCIVFLSNPFHSSFLFHPHLSQKIFFLANPKGWTIHRLKDGCCHQRPGGSHLLLSNAEIKGAANLSVAILETSTYLQCKVERVQSQTCSLNKCLLRQIWRYWSRHRILSFKRTLRIKVRKMLIRR